MQPNTNVLLAGTDQTDEVSHQILGPAHQERTGRHAQPVLRPRRRHRPARPPARRTARASWPARITPQTPDSASSASSLKGNPDILASSDHGFAPQWYAIDAALPLKELGLQSIEQSGNCRATADLAAKECEAGATAQIYLNMKGRQTHDPARP